MGPEHLKYSLNEALEGNSGRINQSGQMEPRFKVLTWGRMEENTELVSYLISQELLHNIIQYAKAKKCREPRPASDSQ